VVKRLAILLVLAVAAVASAGDKPADLSKFRTAPMILTGTVEAWQQGPVGTSYPPFYTGSVTFKGVAMLRGSKPKAATFRYGIRGHQAPAFAKGTKLLVAAQGGSRGAQILASLPATDANVASVKKFAALLTGWRLDNGKPVCPWASVKGWAWPKDAKLKADVVCSKTKRPALVANNGVTFAVEQVPPKKKIKWTNTYGDGQFKLTLKNTNPVEVSVPALLTDGKTIFWADSLVLMHRGKPLLLPGAGALKDLRPMTIKGGQSLSGVIDLLPLSGVSWPRGGSRVQFTFCLGDLSGTNFFYYMSRHHDKLRAQALKKLKQK
jgi:hypothetical protein